MVPPTAREHKILERQRLLAAQMKPPVAASCARPPQSISKSPPCPILSDEKKKAVIDLTVAYSNEANKTLHGLRPPAIQTKKLPTRKRPTKSSGMVSLAGSRAKAMSGNEIGSNDGLSKQSLGKRNDTGPSPKVQRKTGLVNPSSLSRLVQHVSKGNIDDNMVQSLKVHQPDDFWKNLRDWDLPSQLYAQTIDQTAQKDPSSNNHESKPPGPFKKAIPNTFLNARHYVAAWGPLCLAECRAQLIQEMTQNMTSPILVQVESTTSRARHRPGVNNDCEDASWLEENETGGHVMIQSKERNVNNLQFMANDLVVLLQEPYKDVLQDIIRGTAAPPYGGHPDSLFQGISLVGHTESSRREINGLILKVSKRKWVQIGKKEMYLVKIGSNVTALREFTALCSVDTLPMKQFLMGQHLEKAVNRRKLSRNQPIEQLLHQMGGGAQLGPGFVEYAGKKFNQSQLTAIAASAHEYGEGGFTLIKGPPGTGKTTTLVAILNSLHIRQYNKYYDEVRHIATKITGTRETALALARRAKPRLLVCAPSNAAIDNIILKIMTDGFIDGQGRRYNPSMIRVGVGQGTSVRAVALEDHVDNIFNENSDAQLLQSSLAGYRVELTRISSDITSVRRKAHAIENASPWPLSSDWEIRVDEETFESTGKAYFVNHQEKKTTYEVPPPPEPDMPQWKSSSMPEYRAYVSRIVKLVESYFAVKTHIERCSIVQSSMTAGANQFDVRLNLETHVLNSVHMVMTTLGTAGNRVLEGADRFEVIVVDEAAQSVEPASLAALRLGSRHAVLVGDPQQLPATIFNLSGRGSKYDRSLFQRLEEAGQPVYMLNEQYRMHPKISHFPRHIFYGGALLDGPNVQQPDYGNPLRLTICRAVPAFSPMMILDLDSKEERGGTSLSNLSEAKLAVYLYEQLKGLSGGLSTSSKVAVITPYAQQCRLLRRSFSDLLGPRYENSVEVNTVDAFQGREANIVIFSAVRAAGSRGIGFLSDVRRMNVALTRAKYFLFIIARCESIVVNPYWSDLVQHARETNAVVRVPMIGSGSGASFSQLASWKLETPSGGVITSATSNAPPSKAPTDPRKRRRL